LRSITIIEILYCITLWGCGNYKFERHVVFGGPAATRIDRVRQYPLEDQYRIFRYGNDVVEPPILNLAKPIAERGATAVPFLLKQLDAHSDDTTVRDLLAIFQEMELSKSYDVKADSALIDKLDIRVQAIKDNEWRAICSKMLRRIKGD
jgi:hypothetical protein